MSLMVKATRVGFRTTEGKTIWMPASHGIIHDPDAKHFPRCVVFVGPFKILKRKPPAMDFKASAYYGRTYDHRSAMVNVPVDGPWKPVAKVDKIYYFRRGNRAPYGFYHPFAKTLTLEKCKNFYRVNLGTFCVVDDRGFSWP
jgi:hypothetical protein